MNLITKKTPEKSELPLTFIYKNYSQEELPIHFHNWHEVVFVHEGEANIFIDKSFFLVKSGDIIIIPNHTSHHTLPEENSKFVTSIIYFCPSLLIPMGKTNSNSFITFFQKVKTSEGYKYRFQNELWKSLNEYIFNFQKEITQDNFEKNQGILLWFQIIMLYLVRNCASINQEEMQSIIEPSWINNVLMFIEQNLDKKLDLVTLSDISFVSSAHLSRVFKNLFNMNIIDFITTKKMVLAKELLTNSDKTIDIIAKKCGYSSLPYFHRLFKKTTSITPGVYRINYRIEKKLNL